MCVHSIEDLWEEHPDVKDESLQVLPHLQKEFPDCEEGREGECVLLLMAYADEGAAMRFWDDIAHYWDGLTLRFAEMLEDCPHDPGSMEETTHWLLRHLDPVSVLLLATTQRIAGEVRSIKMAAEAINMAKQVFYARLSRQTDGTVN
jgi:hypothetical protein